MSKKMTIFATERNPKDFKYDEKTITIPAVHRYDDDVGILCDSVWQQDW